MSVFVPPYGSFEDDHLYSHVIAQLAVMEGSGEHYRVFQYLLPLILFDGMDEVRDGVSLSLMVLDRLYVIPGPAPSRAFR